MAYPVLSTTAVCQRPYTVNVSFITLVSDLPLTGYRWTQFERATSLYSWDLTYPAITRAEADALEYFFLNNAIGRFATFQWTDPEGVLRTKVRFDQDTLEITYVAPGHWSIQSLRIREVV